ncbi:MAG: hypothetical protein C0403_15935 [Desulfobacterium sp.]|nr:hypothetical protein [Desulfobacterium sp.]
MVNDKEEELVGSKNKYPISNSGQQMPFGMRIVVTSVMLLLALSFSITVISMYYTDLIIFLSKGTIEATVIQKSVTKNKNGKNYYITYSFNIRNIEYTRKVLFGLAEKKSMVTKQQFDSVEEGSTLEVVYSKNNPIYNRLADDNYKDDMKIWFILGILVFGTISLNEIRIMIRNKREKKA